MPHDARTGRKSRGLTRFSLNLTPLCSALHVISMISSSESTVHVPTSAVRIRDKLNHLSSVHLGISAIVVRRGSSISEAQAGFHADDRMERRSSLRGKTSLRRI